MHVDILIWKYVKTFNPQEILDMSASDLKYSILIKNKEITNLIFFITEERDLSYLQILVELFPLKALPPLYTKLYIDF